MESVLIYVLRSTRDNAVRYIGQTKSSSVSRLHNHLRYATNGGGSAVAKWIRREINAKFFIKLLPLCIARINIDEKFYIKRCNDLGFRLLNLTEGGDGGNTMQGKHHSKKTRSQMSQSMMGKNKGKIRSEEFKKKVSETLKRRCCEDPSLIESRIRAGRITGEIIRNSPGIKLRISQSLIGNPRLIEAIRKSWVARKQRGT